MGVLGCSAGASGDGSNSAEKEPLTTASLSGVSGVIPTSATCNRGPGASRCVHVAPLNEELIRVGGTTRFVVDGVRGEKEWFGATRLPYTNRDLKANGNVWLAISKGRNSIGLTTHALHVFLEDIPIDKRLQTSLTGGISPDAGGLLRVYVDNDRFTDPSLGFESADRYYEFNIITGDKSGVYRGNSAAGTDWKKLSSFPYELKLGGCKNDPKDLASNQILRCSAELTLPLSLSVDVRPAPDLEAGFGFGVQPVQNLGGLPEDIDRQDLPHQQTKEVIRRRRLQTVLLGRPQGFKLKMMSFNIRRFYSDSLKGKFKKVTPEKIGQFLDEQGADIIAIQEGWDSVQVKAILTKLNTLRKARKVPEMKAYGPLDFDRAFHLAVQETTGGIFAGETSGETHGGLWIFSPLESVRDDGHVFTPGEACRGEDCFKGKGVQWVRLLLNPPTLTNTICRQTVTVGDVSQEISAKCPLPPSGDHYIDIFNTHMQASGTTLCTDSALSALAINSVLTAGFALIGQGGGLAAAVQVLFNAAQLDWNCYTKTDAEVRAQQFQEINTFIEQVTALQKDRPAVIMGDFNADGKQLEGEYVTLIERLRVGPVMPQNKKTPPSDIITPWESAYDWEIKHGDIVRQHPQYNNPDAAKNSNNDPLRGQDLTGTFILEDTYVENIVSNADWMGNYMGNERYDYVVVRPPSPPDATEFKAPAWLMATNPDGALDSPTDGIWSSPWPGLSGQDSFADPPSKLSDHKPVVANLEMVPLRYLSNYHPTWKHSWEFRAASANLTGVDDCWKEPDPRPTFRYGRWINNGDLILNQDHIGQECENNISVSFPKDGCTHNWVVSSLQNIAEDVVQTGGTQLLEIDSKSCGPNDKVNVLANGDMPYVNVGWNWGGLGLMTFYGSPSNTRWKNDWILFDNATVGRCTRSETPNLCLDTAIAELPPGQQ